jgi:glycerol-3-phosphate O-acyltransferase / dihydroxyacetone phosphate acyltransferase
MRGPLDRFVGVVADAAAFGWFRGVEVAGLARCPEEGPVLVVANHGGGFVDPALLASVLPRTPRFLATATLWRNPILRPLLALAGAIPVYRAQDGTTSGNRSTFEACHEVLGSGGVVAIFPEGQASDAPHLLPVRTGAARIALGAFERGVRGLRLLPVGLIYEDKAKARSRAYVRVGRPLDVDAFAADLRAAGSEAGERDHAAVRRLTDLVARRLEAVSLDYRDAAEMDACNLAARVALRPVGASVDERTALSAVEDVADRLAAVTRVRGSGILLAAETYREALEANAISDAAVAQAAAGRFHRRHRAGAVLTLALVPAAIVGGAVNAVPAVAVSTAGRPAMAPVTRATVKFLLALVAFPLTWAIWAWLASGRVAHPWVVTALAGPACGLAALWVADRLRRGRRARLDLRRLAGVRSSLEDLLTRRAELVEAVAEAVGVVRSM